jgi:hypothetical protein
MRTLLDHYIPQLFVARVVLIKVQVVGCCFHLKPQISFFVA